MVSENNKSWGRKLHEALWAYRTTVRGLTKSTLFSLVYGCEAVIPLEIQLLSLSVAVAEKITDDQNAELRLQELGSLNEKRLVTRQSIEIYQAKIVGSFDKKVREKASKKGDLVLAVRRHMILVSFMVSIH